MITKYDKLSSGHCQVPFGDDIRLFKQGNLSLINAIEATPNVQFSALSSAEHFEDLKVRLTAFAERILGNDVKAIAYLADGRAKEKNCYADI
ncbi:MAG: hypothetical protein JJ858_17155 [Rhizobiaceae bacterium]|nr:hypothetical protein [Rhizobiaceae bacterium]